MCADRVRPEHPERLVHLDAACASGRTFFFLMSGLQSGFPFVALLDADGVEAVFQIHLCEELGSLGLILEFPFQGEGVSIRDRDSVDPSVVDV